MAQSHQMWLQEGKERSTEKDLNMVNTVWSVSQTADPLRFFFFTGKTISRVPKKGSTQRGSCVEVKGERSNCLETKGKKIQIQISGRKCEKHPDSIFKSPFCSCFPPSLRLHSGICHQLQEVAKWKTGGGRRDSTRYVWFGLARWPAAS